MIKITSNLIICPVDNPLRSKKFIFFRKRYLVQFKRNLFIKTRPLWIPEISKVSVIMLLDRKMSVNQPYFLIQVERLLIVIIKTSLNQLVLQLLFLNAHRELLKIIFHPKSIHLTHKKRTKMQEYSVLISPKKYKKWYK